MILTNVPLKVYPSGPGQRWKKGIIQFRSETMDNIGWENQDLLICIINPKERVDPANIALQVEQLNKVLSMEKEIAKIKEGEDYEIK